jgi:hypothetical protein
VNQFNSWIVGKQEVVPVGTSGSSRILEVICRALSSIVLFDLFSGNLKSGIRSRYSRVDGRLQEHFFQIA